MPGTFGALDTGMPDLSGKETTEQKLLAIQDYLVQLLEQLRYTLHNISTENFNEQEVTQFVGGVVAEPIKIAVENAEDEMRGEIDIAADEIRLDVKGTLADEWTVGKTYYLNDFVKVTGTDSVAFYKAKNLTPHAATAGDKPGSGGSWATYWDAVSEPSVQSVIDLNLNGISISYDPAQEAANTPYITLTKDGTTIGGGPVYIGELDAGTITTGALDAGNITLREAFTVQAKDDHNVYQECGSFGGFYNVTDTGIWMKSNNGVNEIYVTNDEVSLYSDLYDSGADIFKTVQIQTTMDGAEISARYREYPNPTVTKKLIIDSTGIYIQDGSNPKKNLFSLF